MRPAEARPHGATMHARARAQRGTARAAVSCKHCARHGRAPLSMERGGGESGGGEGGMEKPAPLRCLLSSPRVAWRAGCRGHVTRGNNHLRAAPPASSAFIPRRGSAPAARRVRARCPAGPRCAPPRLGWSSRPRTNKNTARQPPRCGRSTPGAVRFSAAALRPPALSHLNLTQPRT
jgi:hypothetical protein